MSDVYPGILRYANATTVRKQNFFERIHNKCMESEQNLERIGKEIEETESKSDEK